MLWLMMKIMINIEEINNKITNLYLKKEIEEIKDGQDLILIEKNKIKILLTISDIKKNKNKNISSINLGKCENKLKEFYNISKNESILILKIEVKKKDMKISRIEYEVYYPLNGKAFLY